MRLFAEIYVMGKSTLLILILFTITGCDYYVINPHREQVGHISESKYADVDAFDLCFNEVQWPGHYSRDKIEFVHGRDSLYTYFMTHYDHKGISDQSGYITLRFIVNCKGEIGRFNVLAVGSDYKKKSFHKALVDQLIKLTKDLQGWSTFEIYDTPYDCYTHITFKIDNGELSEILL